MKPVNLAAKLAQFNTRWDPHVVADFNDNEPKGVPNTGDPATATAKPRI